MLNTSGLSLEQAPPISIPLKFFLTASLFFILLGLLLLTQGDELFATRWSPLALSLTHLITLGVLSHVMIGAMMQLLPVLAGAPLFAPVWMSRVVHLSLSGGTLLLILGFLNGGFGLMIAGAVLLAMAFGVFVISMAIALYAAKTDPLQVRRVGLGWLALIPTVVLGVLLVLQLSGNLTLANMDSMVNLHLSWGLLGWVGIVLFSSLFQLIPIFYITREFPAVLKDWLLPLVIVLMVVLSLMELAGETGRQVLVVVVAAIFVYLGILVIRVIHQRKRGIIDTTLLFVWSGMVSLFLAPLVWIWSGDPVLLGVVLLGGVCLTIPLGIIYKIIPFLCWFHLQSALIERKRFDYTLPMMKHFLPEKAARRHYILHVTGLALLLGAYWLPPATIQLAGFLFTLSAIYLCKNIIYAFALFRKEQQSIQA